MSSASPTPFWLIPPRGSSPDMPGWRRHACSLPQVPVIVLDHLSEAQKRAYVLADNKLAENATWNEELLRAELEALAAVEFDLSLIGFSDPEVDHLTA